MLHEILEKLDKIAVFSSFTLLRKFSTFFLFEKLKIVVRKIFRLLEIKQ